jgi:hypothetical protein
VVSNGSGGHLCVCSVCIRYLSQSMGGVKWRDGVRVSARVRVMEFESAAAGVGE